MNSWLAVALASGIVCFSIIVLVYSVLYSKYKERYLLLWAAAWLCHCVRNGFILLAVTLGPNQALLLAEQLLVIATSAFLFQGTYTYYGLRTGRKFLLPLALAVAWVPAAVFLNIPKPWFYIPTYFYFGISQVLCGVVLWKMTTRGGTGGRIAGCSQVLWGLHHLDYPFLRPVVWFAPWGFLIGAALGLLSAIGIMLAYFERVWEELAKSESRFRTLFHSHDAPFILIEPESGHIVDVNAAASKFYGYSPDELHSMNIAELNTLSPGEIATLRREDLLSRRVHSVFTHRLKGDDKRVVEMYSSPVTEGGRELLFSIVHDITDRVRAEQLLRQANETFSTILDSVPARVNVIDVENREILFINKRLRSAQGRDCTGDVCFKALREKDAPCPDCTIPRLFNQDSSPVDGLVYEGLDPMTGEWLLYHARAVRWLDGRLARVQIAVDISHRKQAERTMAASLEEKEVLLREIHHRVKNNLQIISSLLNLQAHQASDPATKQPLTDSRNRIASMAHIHEELYRSRNFGEINLQQYLSTILPALANTCQTGAKVCLTIDAEDVCLALEQAVPFGLLVNELATNAFKHAFTGREKGLLSVSAKRQGDEAVLTVQDDGSGIPDGWSQSRGKTLGMELIQALSGQLRGVMDFDSNGGTRFSLRFPLCRPKN